MKTKTGTRRLISILLSVVVASSLFVIMPAKAYAVDRTVTISQSDSIATIRTNIQNTINASSSGDTVTVTGSRTSVTSVLGLNIPAGVTVIWKADYICPGGPQAAEGVIQLSGAGTFDVANYSIQEIGGSTCAITANGSVTIRISGGTVASSYSPTIRITSTSRVVVTDGVVSNQYEGEGIAIQTESTANPSVTVSGGNVYCIGSGAAIGDTTRSKTVAVVINGGSVECRSSGSAVYLRSDDATLSTGGWGNLLSLSGSAIRVTGLNSSVSVSGGTVRSDSVSGADVIEARRITMSNGWVETFGWGNAIKAIGRDSVVAISGGLVAAPVGYAILKDDMGGSVTISGGFVFSYGESISGYYNDVILMFEGSPTVSGSGIVCAWNPPALVPEYAEGSSTDLLSTSGASTTWGWGNHSAPTGPQTGISYVKGSTSGFYAIIGVTLSAPASSGSSQPTTSSATTPVAPSFSLTVNGGTGGGSFEEGQTITIAAGAAPAGKTFDEWIATGITLIDSSHASITFIMPANEVTLTATYKDLPTTEATTPADTSGDVSSGGLNWMSIVFIGLVVVAAGGATALVVMRKRVKAQPAQPASDPEAE